MSYCRWSSMGWQCDLYVYGDVAGGWTIHVAGRRRTGPIPPDPDWDLLETEEGQNEWVRLHEEQMAAVMASPIAAITLPHAGETFHLATAEEAADKVRELMALGYVAPADLAEDILEDAE